jgi:hypothetical protein
LRGSGSVETFFLNFGVVEFGIAEEKMKNRKCGVEKHIWVVSSGKGIPLSSRVIGLNQLFFCKSSKTRLLSTFFFFTRGGFRQWD